jgi:hypothetical protein
MNSIIKVKKVLKGSNNDMLESILEILEYKESELDITDWTDSSDLYEFLDYDGSLHERIDGAIDIYYYDLREWAVDNYNYIDDAIEEGITDGNDFHQLIQSGQYCYYREEANKAIELIFNKLV